MTKSSQLARLAAAAAALFIAGGAFAQSQGTFTPEIGVSYLGGHTVERGTTYKPNGDHSIGLNGAIGWEHPSGIGVRLMILGDLQPARGFLENATDVKSFDDFYGVQVTGSVPFDAAFNLKLGAGVGRTRLDVSPDVGSNNITDGALSLGLQWRASSHFAMELRVDHLTRSDVTSTGIQFQWPF